MTDPILLSVAEVAALTGLSRSHIRRHAPLVRVGHRTQVPVSWVTALTHHPTEEVQGDEATVGIGNRVPASGRPVGGATPQTGRDDGHRDIPPVAGSSPRSSSRQAARVTVYEFKR
jgi:hypothetical protein